MSDLPSEESSATTTAAVIRTPDQRLRVFVSSTLQELADERAAARDAITKLRLTPVLFELGARPHPPRDLYRAYLDQSHIFVGIYWQHYGWVAPGMDISGLEDEYRLSGSRPKLIYVKTPAPDRELELKALMERIKQDDTASYKSFSSTAELRDLIENDLAVLLTEHFESTPVRQGLSVETRDRRTPPPLPEPLTRFIGRTEELRELERLLPTTRLLTLTGAGGTGKTRLALELAARVMHSHADTQVEAYADGVWLAELAALSDPTALPQTLVALLGLREAPGNLRWRR